MVTRADKITQVGKQPEFFSDFLNNFDRHPVNNTLVKTTNEESVKQSLRNLILTDLGERVFEPTVGSSVRRALFEPNDAITAENLNYYIKSTIAQNEPRVLVHEVQVNSSVDGYTFQVHILFSTINNPNPTVLSLILKRVR